jgi:uncharacterized oxidoreductase
MELSGNTILISGGTSGIGLELASRFLALGNTVIVTGRDQHHLDEVQRRYPGIVGIRSDVSDRAAITALYEQITRDFPGLNILINNAGIMRKINLHQAASDLDGVVREIDINLSGAIRMAVQFLPHLTAQKNSAIVNVTSGIAFVPFPLSPVYSAAKAGLRAFTRALRIQTKGTGVKIFELAPPATETPLFRGDFTATDVAGVKPMSVAVLADRAIVGMRRDVLEIRPGLSNVLKIFSRLAPEFILGQLGRTVDGMLAEMKAKGQ